MRSGDVISDPGGEQAMGADGAASGEQTGYRFGDVTRALIQGDVSGAKEAGRLMRERFFSTPGAADPATADQYPEDRMADEGGPVVD